MGQEKIQLLEKQLQSDLEAARDENESITKRYKEEIARLEAQIIEKDSEIESLRSKFDGQTRSLEEDFSSRETKLSESLAVEVEKTKKAKAKSKTLKENNENLQVEVSSLQKQLAGYKEKMNALEKENEEKMGANRLHFNEVSELRGEIERLKRDTKKRKEKAQKQQSSKDLSLQLARSSLEESQRELKTALRNLQEAQQETEKLTTQVKEANNAKEIIEKKLEGAEKELKALRNNPPPVPDQGFDKIEVLESALAEEKNLRTQFQNRLHEAEKKLREVRLQEIQSGKKGDVKILMEEKHLLEDRIEGLRRELQEQGKVRTELESAFSEKLASLINTIDDLYDKRSLLEKENKNLGNQLEETQSLLMEEAKRSKDLETKVMEVMEEQMRLQNELVDEMQQQTIMKEDFASQLQMFCSQLDSMYDKQLQLSMEKQELESNVDELEQKLLDETKYRVELNERLAQEATLRAELEDNFVTKLQQLSSLLLEDSTSI